MKREILRDRHRAAFRPLLELLETRIVFASDFGDAPLPYKTLLAEGGAEHVAIGPMLGTSRDTEANGVHSANADGDDTTGIDDEDGVTFGEIRTGALGATATVTVSGGPATLDAWIDFNGDGAWGGPLEQIADRVAMVVGSNTISFDVPSSARDGTTYARFRLSTAGNLGMGGNAADGEVEDYAVTLLPPTPACGCFTPHTMNTAADGARSVYAEDVDSDGDIDVLSASAFDDKIAWYENDGTHFFSAHTVSLTANFAASVFAVDVDGDGDTDVLSGAIAGIAWYENDGSQNFSAHLVTDAASGVRSVSAADLDDDGDTDVLSASESDDKIAWYENDGNQDFTAHIITDAANGAKSVYAVDVDGDGDTDILSASWFDDEIAWYENDGNQDFNAHTISSAADDATSVVAADVDGDGDTDVLSASYLDDTIAWYENDGSENFTAHIISTTADGAFSLFATDVDGDGDTDVLSASYLDDKISSYENDGSENFTAHIISSTANEAFSVFAADVDGDGDLDVLSASQYDDKIAWYENLSFHVVNANDAGPGSLRKAILEAHANSGVDTITFAIGSGPQTIAPLSPLPPMTDPVIIDGTTQPGYAGGPIIELWGGHPSGTTHGLTLAADNSKIKGVLINLFPGNGILITGNGNRVEHSLIGVDFSGTIPVPNGLNGVEISGSNNTIGGPGGAGNLIANNFGRGVLVDGGTGNRIQQNSIHSNAGLGIDLVNSGNNDQRAPSVNSAVSAGGTTTIAVSLALVAPSTTYTIEVFSSAVCDPSTFGEGESFLGSKTLTTTVTGRGRTIFVIGFEVPLGHVITATATSPGNDTSEFSKCKTVTAGSAPGGGAQNLGIVTPRPIAASVTRHLRADKPAFDPTTPEVEAVIPTASVRRMARLQAVKSADPAPLFDAFFSDPLIQGTFS